MARRNYLDVRGPEGQGAELLAQRAGYGGQVSAHVYSGPTSLAAVSAWMRGPSRERVLDPHIQHLGIGLMESKWTLLLGRPDVPAAQIEYPPTREMNLYAATAALSSLPTAALSPGPSAPPEVTPQAAIAQAGARTTEPMIYASPDTTRDLLDLINQERQRRGIPPLSLSDLLCRAAQAHAIDMARRDYLGHINPEGEGVDARAVRQGYPGQCGQCIAFGHVSAEAVLRYWMAEPTSAQSVLNPHYQDLGIGLCESRWTLVLGMRQLPVAPAPPPASTWDRVRSALPAIVSAPQEVQRGPDLQLGNKVLALVNTERAKHGRHPLGLSEPLMQAAQWHAHDMLERNYFAYVGPDGRGVEAQVQKSGYAGRSGANLAMGHSSPESVMKFFVQNEGNHQNLLHPDYRHLGVGHVKGRWTLIFGIPAAAPAQMAHGADAAARLIELINKERAMANLGGLALADLLAKAAQAHAEDMARRNYLGSTSPEGDDVGKRADRAGYRWRNISESTAGDRATPEEVVEAWMKVADHRANILEPDFRHIGVGVARGRWAAIFAKPM
jgi:uncharacterized protein YkwD